MSNLPPTTSTHRRRPQPNGSAKNHEWKRPIRGRGAPSGTNKNQTTEDALMSSSSDVADSLRRTMEIMKQELDRSVLSTQMLEDQSNLLSSTSNHYTTFTSLLSTSKSIIRSMERADVVDRVLLVGAMLFFALVCAWILKKRVLDKGLRLVGVVGGKGGRKVVAGVVSSMTSLLASPTSTLASIVSEPTPAAPSSYVETVPVVVSTLTTSEQVFVGKGEEKVKGMAIRTTTPTYEAEYQSPTPESVVVDSGEVLEGPEEVVLEPAHVERDEL